jgi:hypothetical protein
MLLIGKNVTAPGDPLTETPVEKIYRALINPHGEVAVMQARLQQVRAIDPRQYARLKTSLPYIVCARFHPRVRRKENFMDTRRFILDIDHLSEFDLDKAGLVARLRTDPRIELMFTSPGGDGLKLLLRLKNPISDSSYYAMFYQEFCRHFAEAFQLAGAIDSKTHDVARCCFVSYDPEAYYNPDPQPVDPEEYLTMEGFRDFDRTTREIREQARIMEQVRKDKGIAGEPGELSDEVLMQIKQKIGMRVRAPVSKEYIQPEQLVPLVEEVKAQLDEVGVMLEKTEPVNHGRRLKVTADRYWAEIILYYSERKGVTVVSTTKTGSNKELAGMVTNLLKSYFAGR